MEIINRKHAQIPGPNCLVLKVGNIFIFFSLVPFLVHLSYLHGAL